MDTKDESRLSAGKGNLIGGLTVSHKLLTTLVPSYTYTSDLLLEVPTVGKCCKEREVRSDGEGNN